MFENGSGVMLTITILFFVVLLSGTGLLLGLMWYYRKHKKRSTGDEKQLPDPVVGMHFPFPIKENLQVDFEVHEINSEEKVLFGVCIVKIPEAWSDPRIQTHYDFFSSIWMVGFTLSVVISSNRTQTPSWIWENSWPYYGEWTLRVIDVWTM